MKSFSLWSLVVALCLAPLDVSNSAYAQHSALIIDGQNNHGMWPKTTFMMKKYLEETGLFTVDVARTQFVWNGGDLLEKYPIDGVSFEVKKAPETDPDFSPEFSKYDVVISNFGWRAADWPEQTKKNFDDYVKNGGGLVVIHAADNSFGNWPQYNRMIGLGGWGGRNEKSGPYVYFNDEAELVRDTTKGPGGHHGKQHEFQVVVRQPEHPIVKGMPRAWMHAQDELYDMLRGPAEDLEVLATAYASESIGGSGRHEPIIMTVKYGEGRVFHTPLGHADYSMECVGFIATLQRGVEWAATGKVTQDIPEDFPSADETSKRDFD